MTNKTCKSCGEPISDARAKIRETCDARCTNNLRSRRNAKFFAAKRKEAAGFRENYKRENHRLDEARSAK